MCLLTIYISEHCLHWITSLYFCFFHLNVFSNFPCIFWFHFFFFLVWPIACLCVNFQIFMDFPVFLLPAYYRRRKRCRFNPWVRKIPWRRKWQPSPIFLPGKSHGQRSLAVYSPWGLKESDTKRLSMYWLLVSLQSDWKRYFVWHQSSSFLIQEDMFCDLTHCFFWQMLS